MKTVNSDHASEAIMFLQRMTTQGTNSYGKISESAQRVVCSLLLDFMAKLMHQEHPLHKKTWIVDASKPMTDQALQIIAVEISDSHPHPQSRQ